MNTELLQSLDDYENVFLVMSFDCAFYDGTRDNLFVDRFLNFTERNPNHQVCLERQLIPEELSVLEL